MQCSPSSTSDSSPARKGQAMCRRCPVAGHALLIEPLRYRKYSTVSTFKYIQPLPHFKLPQPYSSAERSLRSNRKTNVQRHFCHSFAVVCVHTMTRTIVAGILSQCCSELPTHTLSTCLDNQHIIRLALVSITNLRREMETKNAQHSGTQSTCKCE